MLCAKLRAILTSRTAVNVIDIPAMGRIAMTAKILRDIKAEEYGFCVGDATVAAIIKAYLQEMSAEDTTKTLKRIVSKKDNEGTYTINGLELARLIDRAVAATQEASVPWRGMYEEIWLRNRIKCLRNRILPSLDGRRYVAELPYKMAKFVTDCWLAVS